MWHIIKACSDPCILNTSLVVIYLNTKGSTFLSVHNFRYFIGSVYYLLPSLFEVFIKINANFVPKDLLVVISNFDSVGVFSYCGSQ